MLGIMNCWGTGIMRRLKKNPIFHCSNIPNVLLNIT